MRIDIDSIIGLTLKIPSGNEAGVNSHWLPGGYTQSGIVEATITSPKPSEYIISKINKIEVKL